MTSLHFPDTLVGYVGNNLLYKTEDGGKTWRDISISSNYAGTIYSIYFLSKENGFIAKGGSILQTNDGGNTWKMAINNSSYNLYTVYFKDTEGFIGGSGEVILKRTCNQITTGLANQPNLLANFSIYPNPNQGEFNILYYDLDKINIKVFNSIGSELKPSTKSTPNEINLNFGTITPGVYFVEISNGGNRTIKKVIIE
jgi:hypothetical protein